MNKQILIILVIILGIFGLTMLLSNLKVDPQTQITGPANSGVIAGQDIPEAQNYVNDNANIIDATTEATLNTNLKAVSDNGKAEIAILTVNSMNGLSIEEFAIRVMEKWKVGKAGKDNGIIIIIAVQERKVRIETGRGSTISDSQAGNVLDTSMVPLLRNNNWSGAITAGVDALITLANK